MKKYKVVEEKIEEALKISRETGKEHGFNICQSGTEITSTNIHKVQNR